MKMFVAVFLVAVVSASKLEFEINVLENKARFVEKITTDLNNNHVVYDTPAHNNVDESHTIQDFKQGFQLTCVPALRECHLTDIDTFSYPNAGNLTESIVHMWNEGINSIVDEKPSNVVKQRISISGPEITNTAFLSKEMRNMLTMFGFPLYKATPIPENAIIQELKHERLVKRQTGQGTELQCYGQAPQRKYGYTAGHLCNRFFLCEETANRINCHNEHITVDMHYTCVCCPGHFTLTNPNKCQCNKWDI